MTKTKKIQYRRLFPSLKDAEKYQRQQNERFKHGKWLIYSRLTGNGKAHVFAVFDDAQYKTARGVLDDLVHDPDCAYSNKYHCDRSWWLRWVPGFKTRDDAYRTIHRRVSRYESRQGTKACEQKAKREDILNVFDFRKW